MEGRQSSRQDGADGSSEPRTSKDKVEMAGIGMRIAKQDLGGETKKIDAKPTSSPTLSLLAKNAVLLPSGIVRVKQLHQTPPNQPTASSSSGSATGNPRNKTALAPGHSLMDWIRLGSSGVDLTGVGGRLLTVTPAELAKHNKENDAWIAIRGVVFNVSRYMSFHPGGVSELMKGVGKDATKLFDDVHAWVNYQSILQKCVVGRLERSLNAELYLESDKDKPKKDVKNESATKPVLDPPSVKMDWWQTTNSISLFYSTPVDNPVGECQIKKLTDAECSVRIYLEKSGDIVTHNVKLTEDVEWPPNCQRSSEVPEIEIVFKKKDRGIWKTYGTHLASHEKIDLAKRTYNEYEVLENTELCNIVHLLVLRALNYVQIVPPGRHVEVKTDVMGTEVSRSYTPVPYYLHPEERPSSACSSDCLCLMIKRYEDGALSPKLTSLEQGSKIEVSHSLGDFCAESYDDCTKIHMLAAGSGLTAMLSIVKRALARRNVPNINLINFNRTKDCLFYTDILDRVSRERTLTVTHVLSEPAEGTWNGKTGSVTKELLKDLIGERSVQACIFTCGSPGFMKVARESLLNLGWEASQMYEFGG